MIALASSAFAAASSFGVNNLAASNLAVGNPTKSPDGAMGLVVFAILAVVVVFLFRSMNKHLRKVARIKFEENETPTAAKLPQSQKPKDN